MRRKRRICIVQFDSEAYSKHYIVQALFKLMGAYEYDKISVTDIANKAGVGRATFYRYFKRKEDVIVFYFEHNTREFVFTQRFEPRCREDYVSIAKNVFKLFKQSKEPLKLLKKARLEHLYLDYLNKGFVGMFDNEHPELDRYTPYIYAGMLFNVSMAWLENDCAEDADSLAESMVGAIID